MNKYIHSLRIGNLLVPNNVFLAPMAGITNMPFREICHSMGAGLVCTELVTARGMRFKKSIDKNYRYLEISAAEQPVAIQLFGADPEDFKVAIDLIFTHPVLSLCSMIDINMGCPVPKVVKTGSGSALMKNLPLAGEIIKTCVNTSPVPVSVKFRKGWNEQSINAVEFGSMCEASGASLITIHGRTANQMYSGNADWDIIRQVKEKSTIPVIGNGDIKSPAAAVAVFDQTAVDGIMIGRAAMGNPWIFTAILSDEQWDAGRDSRPSTIEDRLKIIRAHLSGMINQLGEETAIKEMRKQFALYLKGIAGAAEIKKGIMTCCTEAQILEIFNKHLNSQTI